MTRILALPFPPVPDQLVTDPGPAQLDNLKLNVFNFR